MEILKEVWLRLSPSGKAAMANRLMTSKADLSQVAHGHRNPGIHYKIAIEKDIAELQQKPFHEIP